mgnify:CR=1 FL=1
MDLVINTFGVSLSRDNDGFVISNHDGVQKVPVAGIRSIQLSRGAQISSDAVLLAVENEIEIIFMGQSGMPMGRIWSPKYGSVSTIRKGQLTFTFEHDAVVWIKDLISRKIQNQQAMMLMMNTSGSSEMQRVVDKSINRLEDYRKKISALDGEIVSDISSTLRGWEGVSSKIYFDTMNLFLPETYRFESRSQHPAMDVANAMLNYGYGLLYGRIEGALIKAGIDPYVGVMHRDDYNRPVLVYDVIELYRVWIDYVVFSLLCQNVITEEHYSVRGDGSYWLEPLGRRVLIQSVNDYLEEVIEEKGLQRSRATQIVLYAQNLAQKFKKYV